MTEELFRDDAYMRSCKARILTHRETAIELDRTVFYPKGGGQPGDSGIIRIVSGVPEIGGEPLAVTDTVRGADYATDDPRTVLHVTKAMSMGLPYGTEVEAELDWQRRYRHMRMHTALHLLCQAVIRAGTEGQVTGGQIGDGKGRLDFDLPDVSLDKSALAERLNAWIEEDHEVRAQWVEAADLERRPELVRTAAVAPPSENGKVRLIEIEGVDLQACGGTHVKSTKEIGRIGVAKIENKGRHNRRIQLMFEE